LHQQNISLLEAKTQLADLEARLSSARLALKQSESAFNASRAEMLAVIQGDKARIVAVPVQMNQASNKVESFQVEYDVATSHARAQLSKETTELATSSKKADEMKASIVLLRNMVSERTVRSPIDGAVTKVSHLAPGEMLVRGQELMTIVPADQQLVVRAQVRSADIGFVRKGQQVRLRIAAFPCEDFGVVNGIVEAVGSYPEEAVEQNKKESVYRVRIAPASTSIGSGAHRMDLRIGMNVDADIVVRKRTLLTLLLEPFFKDRL
jgi:HlyD family secretion protein